VQHLKDYEFAQEWVKNYEAETKRIFVCGTPGRKPFEDWLNAQVKKNRLSIADVDLIIDETIDLTATTEARANLRTALAALLAGAPDLATKRLVGYVNALKSGGQYATPAQDSRVRPALVAEFKKAYQQMPKGMQEQYKTAVKAAMKANPDAWISELDFSKMRR
jgi:hypothetical protein